MKTIFIHYYSLINMTRYLIHIYIHELSLTEIDFKK